MSDAEKTKTRMSDEERRALAEKLDRDLDEFISSRKETRYTEGWNEATWEQVGRTLPDCDSCQR